MWSSSTSPCILGGPRQVVAAFATAVIAGTVLVAAPPAAGQGFRLVDEGDRGAFRAWFTFLADAQFERRTEDVVDCAALVRHAYREALRPHTPAWYQAARLPAIAAFPDVRRTPPAKDGAWLLFRVARSPDRFAEFADAETIVRLNARPIGRDPRALRPGDLLFFTQPSQSTPNHLMVFVGESPFDRSRRDWLVYHTGPADDGPGEVRKVSLADLQRHPSVRWRPAPANPAFVGVFRLTILDGES